MATQAPTPSDEPAKLIKASSSSKKHSSKHSKTSSASKSRASRPVSASSHGTEKHSKTKSSTSKHSKRKPLSSSRSSSHSHSSQPKEEARPPRDEGEEEEDFQVELLDVEGKSRPVPRRRDEEALDDLVHFDPADSSEESVDTLDFLGASDLRESERSGEAAFACLSPDQVIGEQKRIIAQVAELLGISASNASNLIRHYQWRQERLLAAYFDDPDGVHQEAGLYAAGHEEGSRAQLEGEAECLVCCDEGGATDHVALGCGHRFCRGCWSSYLALKIDEGAVLRINCPAARCTLTVPDDLIKELVPASAYDKYVRFVTKSFVEDGDHLTWCPAPGCGNAITSEQRRGGHLVECSCGYRFCFACHEEDHWPATCAQARQWAAKCSDESETGHWLGANTKGCPKCAVQVEKNGGCNHMTCAKCSHEWCWMCSKTWKGHDDFYACARYDKAQAKAQAKADKGKKAKKARIQAEEEERETKRRALERYLGFYHKYLEHDAATKRGPEQRERARAKMEALQQELSTLSEVRFIEKATGALLACQLTLRNAHVYAYFLEVEAPPHTQHLFQFQLAELERTAQQLVASLEAPHLLKKRTEVVDLTALALSKRAALLSAAEHDD